MNAPEAICLRPGAVVLEVSAEQMHVVFANHTATFNGIPIVRGMRAAVAALQTPTTRADVILRLGREHNIAPQLAEYLMELLGNSQCLYVAASDRTGAGEGDPLACYFSSIGVSPEPTLERLRRAEPLIIAPASAAERVVRALRLSGILATPFVVQPGTNALEAIDQIDEGLGGSSRLVAVWGFAYRLPFTRRLNEMVLKRGRLTLFGGVEGVMGHLGPLVVPGETPCLECLVLRLVSNAGRPERDALAAYRLRDPDRIPDPWPSHPVFEEMLACAFALEIAGLIRGLPSRLIGAVVDQSFVDGAVERHLFSKVPRCASCGSRRPPRSAWDACFPAPVVKGSGA